MGHHDESHKHKIFKDQIGQKVAVSRSNEKSEGIKRANQKLLEVGEMLNPLPKNLTYMGSAAVHIYYNETLRQAFFANQVNTLGNTNELLAQAATKDFLGTVMEFFGKRRPKLRSGF